MLEHERIMPSGLGRHTDTIVLGGSNGWTEIKRNT
jgi:hypothetical protein